jgi:hypothetical protein
MDQKPRRGTAVSELPNVAIVMMRGSYTKEPFQAVLTAAVPVFSSAVVTKLPSEMASDER